MDIASRTRRAIDTQPRFHAPRFTQRLDTLRGGALRLRFAEFHRIIAWTSHGILFEYTADESGDQWIDLLLENGNRQQLVRGFAGRLSPDERWLAYVSDDDTQSVVRVTAFPDDDQGREISPRAGVRCGHPEGTRACCTIWSEIA